MFRVIQNMCSGIKPCIRKDGELSEYCMCNIGVRQGETLFSLFLNDLEDYLSAASVKVPQFMPSILLYTLT